MILFLLRMSVTSHTHTHTHTHTVPPIPSLVVNRLSNFSIELIVNLAYTGGGDISILKVSFRKIGTVEWIIIGEQEALSMSDMTWKALVRDERFVGINVEFQVAVKNARGLMSGPVVLFEPLGKAIAGKGVP